MELMPRYYIIICYIIYLILLAKRLYVLGYLTQSSDPFRQILSFDLLLPVLTEAQIIAQSILKSQAHNEMIILLSKILKACLKACIV